jgi:hypothetical protein
MRFAFRNHKFSSGGSRQNANFQTKFASRDVNGSWQRWIVLSSSKIRRGERRWQMHRRRREYQAADTPPLPNALRSRRGDRSTLVQRLRWRRFAVCKNFSNGRRKIINARAGHDDAVTTAVSFLSDTQESAALIFPELDVEMLALNLQFSRLDDVIHFASEVAEFRESNSGMEEKFAGF